MRYVLALVLTCLLMAGAAAAAVSPDERLADPALETRARAISKGLRCLVCQNQSIDDSDAPLARDLRRIVRERLAAGDDEAAIRSYLVGRYGEFVLLAPPLRPGTLLLWAGPFAILVTGGITLAWLTRRRAKRNDDGLPGSEGRPLDEAETRELDTVLAGDRPS
jgi:cytochrome c-type biogenesis protein CcmH